MRVRRGRAPRKAGKGRPGRGKVRGTASHHTLPVALLWVANIVAAATNMSRASGADGASDSERCYEGSEMHGG